ncbi:unnamed protein product [Lymnaea stagnalis]|uniref:Uncharacterized protein n=1 Tax=Lymnaea stagnalis TaxID=6523 RepID=A0AAV2HDL1_LYMST
MLGEFSFFTIAWIFWRKARSMAAIRNLFQNPDQPGPKTAISDNPNDDKTSLGSAITDRFTQVTPDAVLDQHDDLHSEPMSRTELVYLAAQKTPGQELIDRSDIMSGISRVNSEHQGSGRRSKLI